VETESTGELIQLVDLRRYLDLYPDCDPFEAYIWDEYVLRPERIWQHYRADNARETSVRLYSYSPRQRRYQRQQHERRVAWLMLHGWTDPIDIDVGVPALGYGSTHCTCDGNHRIAAALLMDHPYVLATCSGQVSCIDEFLWR
jgi:hypothetical protein